MERHLIFMGWKTILLEFQYSENWISASMQSPLQLLLKFRLALFRNCPDDSKTHMESKKSRIAETILKKKNQTAWLMLLEFKTIKSQNNQDCMIMA